jgi:PE family protein
MSWVVAAPEYVSAAASDLANIGSAISSANAAALVPTSGVLAAGAAGGTGGLLIGTGGNGGGGGISREFGTTEAFDGGFGGTGGNAGLFGTGGVGGPGGAYLGGGTLATDGWGVTAATAGLSWAAAAPVDPRGRG